MFHVEHAGSAIWRGHIFGSQLPAHKRLGPRHCRSRTRVQNCGSVQKELHSRAEIAGNVRIDISGCNKRCQRRCSTLNIYASTRQIGSTLFHVEHVECGTALVQVIRSRRELYRLIISTPRAGIIRETQDHSSWPRRPPPTQSTRCPSVPRGTAWTPDSSHSSAQVQSGARWTIIARYVATSGPTMIVFADSQR
jgi:hypothetical protein